MNQINLVDYAEHSLKVPSEFLAPVAKKNEVKLWKVFLGHYLDFSVAFLFTTLMATMFNQSLKAMLVTRSLTKIWPKDEMIFEFSGSVLPTMVFSYFFFSYFLNHGQTWGMHLFKKRIHMKDKSFKEAALWACSSMVLCFTCGLSYFIKKDKWQEVKSHDYLYDHMMIHRDIAPIHLISEIAKFESEKAEAQEEIWSRAA